MLDFLFAQLLILLNDKKYLFNCDKVPLTWQENRHQISYWPASVHRRQLKLTMHFTNYVSPASIFRPNSSHFSMRVKIPHNVCVMSGPAARLLVCTHSKQQNRQLVYRNSMCAERSTCHAGLLTFFGDFAPRMRIASFVGLGRWDVHRSLPEKHTSLWSSAYLYFKHSFGQYSFLPLILQGVIDSELMLMLKTNVCIVVKDDLHYK